MEECSSHNRLVLSVWLCAHDSTTTLEFLFCRSVTQNHLSWLQDSQKAVVHEKTLFSITLHWLHHGDRSGWVPESSFTVLDKSLLTSGFKTFECGESITWVWDHSMYMVLILSSLKHNVMIWYCIRFHELNKLNVSFAAFKLKAPA